MNRKFVDSDFSKAKTWAKLLGSANLVDEFAIVGTSLSSICVDSLLQSHAGLVSSDSSLLGCWFGLGHSCDEHDEDHFNKMHTNC